MGKTKLRGVKRKSWGSPEGGGVTKRKVGRPRKPKPPKVTRKNNYRTNYTLDMLDQAEEHYRELRANNDKTSLRAIADSFGVPKSTLSDRISGKSSGKLGRPTALTPTEETLIVQRLQVLGEWGFPFTKLELQFFVQSYLNVAGKNISRFVENLPGPDWVDGFLGRHPELTVRKANLIKRSRGEVSHEVVKEFFENFLKSTHDIPPGNLLNYDETNLRDDPGAKNAIFKRGVKYAELVADHTKSSVSVMFAGTDDGTVLPPFVVYKAGNLYPSWCEGGPKGARYHVTPSGWFDMEAFREWFKTLALPWAKRRGPGKKAMLGDNLASHIDDWVIQKCKENEIEFICLPPNSTHLLQPLDVGVFAPMKAGWRKIIRKYKKLDPSANMVAKVDFPRLLKELCTSVPLADYLPTAFRKCGLVPVDPQQVLARIPDVSKVDDICDNMDSVLKETLEVKRFNKPKNKKKLGKKLPPGQSYSSDDSSSVEDNEDNEENAVRGSDRDVGDSDQDEMEVSGAEEEMEVSGAGDTGVSDGEETGDFLLSAGTLKLQTGELVAALYEEQWFVAEVMANQEGVRKGFVKLSYWSIRGINTFAFAEDDVLDTHHDDIICKVKTRIVNTNRNYYGVSNSDLDAICKFMANIKS